MRSPVDLITARVHRLQDSARQTRAAVTRPKPPVRLELGRNVPAWTLRAAVLVLTVVGIVVLDPAVVGIVLISGGLLLAVALPSAASGAVLAGVFGFFWMVEDPPALGAAQFALLAIIHLCWVLSGVAAGLPLRTRVELAVLRPTLIRFVIMNVICQLLLAGAQLLRRAVEPGAGPVPTTAGIIVLVLAVLLAITAWLVLPRLTSSEEP